MELTVSVGQLKEYNKLDVTQDAMENMSNPQHRGTFTS